MPVEWGDMLSGESFRDDLRRASVPMRRTARPRVSFQLWRILRGGSRGEEGDFDFTSAAAGPRRAPQDSQNAEPDSFAWPHSGQIRFVFVDARSLRGKDPAASGRSMLAPHELQYLSDEAIS